jgi:hypothetical protein
MEKFGVKIWNWAGKCTLKTELSKPMRQSIVMIVLYCQYAVIADGADNGGGKPELYIGSKNNCSWPCINFRLNIVWLLVPFFVSKLTEKSSTYTNCIQKPLQHNGF